jgi:hypothetical protein
MSDTFGMFEPQHEPEVQAKRRKAKSIGIWQSLGIVLLVAFLCGILLGACVAGIMLPVKGVQWLFS